MNLAAANVLRDENQPAGDVSAGMNFAAANVLRDILGTSQGSLRSGNRTPLQDGPETIGTAAGNNGSETIGAAASSSPASTSSFVNPLFNLKKKFQKPKPPVGLDAKILADSP